MSEYELEVAKYFEGKAESYDNVEKQAYWRLSDKLLWLLLKKELDSFPGEFTFLDAGGGTGRWSKRILDEFPKSKGVLIDISESMLNQAKRKNSYGDRWTILRGDIQDIEREDGQFDIVINTHNVLGFVEDSEKALSEMSRLLRRGGKLISVVPNYYHAIFFNLFLGDKAMAEEIKEKSRGKFVGGMPSLDLFSVQKIRDLYQKNNLGDVIVLGFPVTIYPGYQDTQLSEESDKQDFIENNFDKLFEIEKGLVMKEEAAARGNNLMAIGIKK